MLNTGVGYVAPSETWKAFSDAIAGKNADGLEMLREFEDKIQQRGVGDPEATNKMAQAYAVLGDKTSALRMFRSSIEDPLLKDLRGSPEFSRLLLIARQRHEAFKKAFF